MKEYNDLFEKFSKLGVNDKRDALSEEVMKITYLMRTILNKYGQDIIDEPYNYSKIKDEAMEEGKFLDLEYKDLYNIKTELMLLISMLDRE